MAGAAGFAGALFISLIALLFRQAIPGVCWLLLGFFGKRVQEVEPHEAALMAALIRGPTVYSPYRYRERAIERQKLVLIRPVKPWPATVREVNPDGTMELDVVPPNRGVTLHVARIPVKETDKTPHSCHRVKKEVQP